MAGLISVIKRMQQQLTQCETPWEKLSVMHNLLQLRTLLNRVLKDSETDKEVKN